LSASGTKRCVLLGCGGHASVLIEALNQAGDAIIVAALDRDPSHWGKTFKGISVVGGDESIAKLAADGVTHFVNGVGSTGESTHRVRIYEAACEAGLEPLTVRHPSATVSSEAILADGCQIFPAAVVNADASIGFNAIINTAAVIEHGCVIHPHAHVAPRAVLGGNTIVERGAHVGIGATVKENIRIGTHAIVGAGAVVISDVEPNTTVKGVPAR
jgi:sugar O-acyltransferase (sialic acid O-acetyltransferase NeuD family)